MRHFGLVGFPLTHTFSPSYFEWKFNKLGIKDADYQSFPLESLTLLDRITGIEFLQGFNVTIPYKTSIIPYLDRLDPIAKNINAVNTVRIIHENNQKILIGFNTDVEGFRRSLLPLLPTKSTKAMVFGTGGAAKAICYALHSLSIPFIQISRSRQEKDILTYSDITPAILRECKLLINCTPVGMYPGTDDCIPIDYQILDSSYLLYDLVYNPELSRFLSNGLKMGTQIKNGLEMLHLQADAAWELWNSSESSI